MTADARDRVLELLFDGKISSAEAVIVNLRRVAAKASVLTRRVTLAESAFAYEIGDFAFLLAHEAQHTRQLFTAPWNREADADAYGCANTWGRHGYRSGAYRAQYGPCGSGAP